VIPRLIHRIWIGGPEPEWIHALEASWRRPGWNLRHWDEHEIRILFPLHNQDLYDRAEELAPDHVGQLRADILRYEILHRRGGVYVDADFECLRPIDPLIKGLECFAAWEAQDRWIANGFMGAVPGHPFIERLIEELPASIAAARRGTRPNRMSGPHYLTRKWREHGRGTVEIIDQQSVFPYNWREIRRMRPGMKWPRSAYAVHHWSNMRREQGVAV
jgi:mannosyltransferase OCH1-like enzyme